MLWLVSMIKLNRNKVKLFFAGFTLVLLSFSPVAASAQEAFKVGASAIYLTDPSFTYDNTDTQKSWGLIKANFLDAWEKTIGSPEVKVAVIDTGIDETHVDLQTVRFLPGFDFVAKKDLPIGSNSDDNGHGTLVAGILGATPNNATGVVGTNWNIALMPLKILDAKGSGDSGHLTDAINFAVNHGAHIINISLGGSASFSDTSLANSIKNAYDKGVIIVAAVGNDSVAFGSSTDAKPVYPVCDDGSENMIIGVIATDYLDHKADFSNYGKNCVDVAAPGKTIISTISIDPASGKPEPNSYAYASGTSLAVPFVSGQAALLKAYFPKATNKQIRDRIIFSADNIDKINEGQCSNASCSGLLGAGRINVARSLSSNLLNPNFTEGEVVVSYSTNNEYLIQGGKKSRISNFVKSQKFSSVKARIVLEDELRAIAEGPYVLPAEGTLVKSINTNTVYLITKNAKSPLTFDIFNSRQLKFSDVVSLDDSEVNSWLLGKLATPQDGTLVKSLNNQTVYWVVSGELHPINFNFYTNRGLNVFPIMIINKQDLGNMPIGQAYVL